MCNKFLLNTRCSNFTLLSLTGIKLYLLLIVYYLLLQLTLDVQWSFDLFFYFQVSHIF
jgi:hypothetical protein